MKIIRNDVVYVQKNDMGFLNQTDLAIPVSIFMKVFGNGITIIDDSNRFEFVKFEEASEIEYFKNLDWIVDYDSIKDLSEEQIIELGQMVAQERNRIAQTYNVMSKDDREKNMHMIAECEKLDFKMYSLRDVIWFKKGQFKITLPDGVDYPEMHNKVEKKGLRRLLKRFSRKTNS